MYTVSTDKIITTFCGETISLAFDISDYFESDFYNEDEVAKGKFIFRLYHANCGDSVLEKEPVNTDVLTGKSLIFSFDSSDTKNLPPQTYYYDIRLFATGGAQTKPTDVVKTVIPAKKFILK